MNKQERLKELLKRSAHEEKILHLMLDRDQYTWSDLQGMVSAIVIQIIEDYT